MYLKDQFVKVIVEDYQQVCEMQTPEGQFLDSEIGYTVYNQYAGLYFAYLYTCKSRENPYFGKPELLERAVRAWDFYYTQVDEEGLAKIITFNQFWHNSIDEWGAFHWMNTIELLKPYLVQEKIVQWYAKIAKTVQAIGSYIKKRVTGEEYRKNLEEYNVENHFIWTVLCYYRYGMLKDDTSIMDFARLVMEEILDHQSPAGTWLEGKTLVVSYAGVSLSAVSLFELYDHNEKAAAAVDNSLKYILSTTYPDFTKNECVDGRNRYSKKIVAYTAPTYYRSREGTAYLSRAVSYILDGMKIGRSLQALTILTEVTHAISKEIPYIKEDLRQHIPEIMDYPEHKAKIINKGCWTITMCCLEQKSFGNRWILERQNLLSIYHTGKGLLIGGGHSVAQPDFSSFNVISKGNVYYLHENGEITGQPAGMRLSYGGKLCTVQLLELDPDKVTVRYAIDGLDPTDRGYVHIPLVGRMGSMARLGDSQLELQSEHLARFIPANTPFFFKEVQMSLSENAVFNYPIFPFNPYKQKQCSDFSEVFGILTIELNFSRPACVLELNVREENI